MARQERTNAARDRIIDVAERLFGEEGVDRVSLRQISAAAGNANNFAVQYHFKDREGLIRAIFEKRLPQIEAMRLVLRDRARENGTLSDPRTLVEVIHRPSAELRNADGERSYALFLLSLFHSRDGLEGRFGEVMDLAPSAMEMGERLFAALPHLPRPLLIDRWGLGSAMFLGIVVHGLRQGRRPESVLIENALDMVTAAITAPVSPTVNASTGR